MFRHQLFPFNLGGKWWVLDVFLRSDWDMDLCRKINCITCDADAKAANPSAIRNVVERGKSWLLREYHPLHQNTSKMGGGSRGIMLTCLYGIHWGLARIPCRVPSCKTYVSPSTHQAPPGLHETTYYLKVSGVWWNLPLIFLLPALFPFMFFM